MFARRARVSSVQIEARLRIKDVKRPFPGYCHSYSMPPGRVFRRGAADLRGRVEILSSSTEPAVLSRVFGNGTAANVLGACTRIGVSPNIILPRIAAWALEAVEQFGDGWAIELTTSENPAAVEYTARQCRGLLANALFGNLNDTTAKLKDAKSELCRSPCHVCAGTGLAPSRICTGTGLANRSALRHAGEGFGVQVCTDFPLCW